MKDIIIYMLVVYFYIELLFFISVSIVKYIFREDIITGWYNILIVPVVTNLEIFDSCPKVISAIIKFVIVFLLLGMYISDCISNFVFEYYRFMRKEW